MATRAEKILLRARDTLADPDKERWTDDRLLRLVNEAQEDIAKQSRILKGRADVSMEIGVAEYPLPDDVWLITRATFDDCPIKFVSYDQMDELARKAVVTDDRYNSGERYNNDYYDYQAVCWDTETGDTIDAIVYDRRDLSKLRVYPIPNESLSQNDYTFENAGPPTFTGDEYLGVVSAIDDYTFDSVFGVVTNLYDPFIDKETFQSPFGVVTSINESKGVVRVWYIRMPTPLVTLADELDIPSMFDTTIKHYVVGHAFDDDMDTRFQEKSAKALGYYERDLAIAKKTDRQDGTRATQHNTSYRGPFE
jgi:hypothetical protein